MHELPEESLERFTRVEKLLRTQRSLPAKLESVAAIARRTVPNCDAAGISLIVDGEPTTTAVSDRLAIEIDLVQYKPAKGHAWPPSTAEISSGWTSWRGTADSHASRPEHSPWTSTASCPCRSRRAPGSSER